MDELCTSFVARLGDLERRFVDLEDSSRVMEDLLKMLDEKNKGKATPSNLGLKLLEGKQPSPLNPKPRSGVRQMSFAEVVEDFSKGRGGG